MARAGFRDGNWSVFLTLALCLAVSFGGLGLVVAGALISIAASRLRLLSEAVKVYFTAWLRSDAFAINMLLFVVTLIELGLTFYHGDDMAEFETQLKQYVAALAVLLTIRRFPVETVLWGAAAGCLLAGAVAVSDIVVWDIERAAGPTNAIRFGMLAALLSMISWTGALFARIAGSARIFMAVASLAGIFAVVASGSRGAVIAIPVMLLMLVPRIWRWAGRAAIYAGIVFLVFSAAIGVWQLNSVRSGLSGMQELVSSVISGERIEEQSARDRITMLRLAARLSAQNPWLGVGDVGWAEAVAEQRRVNPPGVALTIEFNQAHNQYANDFAKGGLLRGLGGVATLFLPLFLFLRRNPFRLSRQSLAPLLGVLTCSAYAVFALTESVMDLSLTASVYVILVLYLVAAAEGAPLSYRSRSRPFPAGKRAV